MKGDGNQHGKGRKSLRVIAYLGMDRPSRKEDFGELLVRKVIDSRHTLAGLIIHPSDHLADIARRHSIPYIAIPAELLQPAARIKKALEENHQFIDYYKIWLEHIRSFNADIGVSIWSYWMPQELFSMPAHGFVNYHPAPLPQMRGMEPDTFAILEGRTEIFGTVHRVNHAFDCGDIISWTNRIPIHRYDTPVSVLENLNREGIGTIIHVFNSFADGSVNAIPQCAEEGTRVTRDMARAASVINWEADSVDLLDRKLRAFCGQDIGIRLKGVHCGEIRDVVDIEGYRGHFPGKPGEIIGCYNGTGLFHNMPVIRVADGAAVVRFGRKIRPLPYSSIFYPECPQELLILPGKRIPHTKKTLLMKSLSVNG